MLRYAQKLKGKKNMLDCQCWQTQVPEIVIRKDLTKFGSIASNQISLQAAPRRENGNKLSDIPTFSSSPLANHDDADV